MPTAATNLLFTDGSTTAKTENGNGIKRKMFVSGEDVLADNNPLYIENQLHEEPLNAEEYLEHLLNDGAKEGDSGYKMQMPTWYDEELFIKGQSFMSKYRFVITSGMLSGLVAVLAIPSILQVLICTRQSSTPKDAYQRYIRTIFHTYSWYRYKPSDERFWTSIKAVRKAHSRSSHKSQCLGNGKITQKDMALTQFGFIGFLTVGAYRIQLYDKEFLEATSHMWRVLGYLLGMKDEYNICGRNWSESEKRLEIVMRKVYVPALETTGDDFQRMTKSLIDGLWPVNTVLTVGSFLFYTKRLAYVKGYEYYEFDNRPGTILDPNQKRYYYDMNWWDRFLVSYGLFIVTYLHKYNIIRWYLNLRVLIAEMFMYYLPYIAVWKWGIKWAYIRIFNADGTSRENSLHLKVE